MSNKNIFDRIIESFDINDEHVINLQGEACPTASLLAYKLFNESDENIVILAQNNHEANKILRSVSSLLSPDDVIIVPSDELIRVEYISQSKELLAQQIVAINDLINCKHKVIILPTQSAYRYYPSKELFLGSILKLKVGQNIELDYLKNKLVKMGYYRVNKIDQSLQFASRGDILDIFSLNYENPIRIEFFGDEIESIRFFTIENQTSIDKIQKVQILPATLNLLTDQERLDAPKKLQVQADIDIKKTKSIDFEIALKGAIQEDLDLVKTSNFSSKFYKYMGVLQGFHPEITSYFDNYKIIHAGKTAITNYYNKILEESNSFLKELSDLGRCISGLSYYNNDFDIDKKASNIFFIDNIGVGKNTINTGIGQPTFKASVQSLKFNLFHSYKGANFKVVVLLNDPKYILKTEELLNLLTDIKYKKVTNFDLDLEDENTDVYVLNTRVDLAFEYAKKNVVFLTEKELYGAKRHASTYKKVFKEGTIINSYEELVPGDYVVHEDYGIGEFVGIRFVELSDIHADYIELKFANDQKLFVPLYQFNMIRKYVGREGRRPKLSRLSTNQWEKTKAKIKERVNELADRLLFLYQERKQIEGFKFSSDNELERVFEQDFEHELTHDQEKAVEEIKGDMESPFPMDRLLCGDVGFGKTEVAFRAAFKALINGKQVALLCPTTLLARQHYELAKTRFRNFDVGIGIISRLQKPADNKKTIQELKEGKVNFLIGTHAILSKNVIFKDLGLLIIDEEQRFGVEQKEKIKEKSTNIDVLTLSATPIPRTLQSTLVGLKTTSTITTPPKERMPIQTYVMSYKEGVVKELIERELERSGQVFYVHNNIATIYERANTVMKLCPEAKVAVIHAKMSKDEIEDTMLEFVNGEIDVLVATSIIENGIDIRNANLILVDDADHFGLAQLYQIKGRVGRGDRMAFAYLFVDEDKNLSEDAAKRLRAIEDFTELGSGYKIAQRDLLIRGAGDILGPEQAGFIDAIGIDMYIRILNQTVREKQTNIHHEEALKTSNLQIDGYIPSSFVDDKNKLEIYHHIIDSETILELESVRRDIEDIYGKLPLEVNELFTKKKIEILLQEPPFEKLQEMPSFIKLTLTKKFSTITGIGTQIFTSLVNFLSLMKIQLVEKQLIIYINKHSDYIGLLITVLNTIINLYNINVENDLDEN